jgi:stage II sporulation protein D
VKIRTPHLTRIYRGQIEVSTQSAANGTELVILNRIPLSDYTACVTAFESAYDHSQPEYLKALAVVVRTYALSHRHRHGTYDLCDLSHCQVYQGIPPKFPFWKKIAEAGAAYSFPPAVDTRAVYYNRCCGGMLESADQIWGGAPSPSRTGPDEWEGEVLCQADPLFRWASSAEAGKVESVLKAMAHLPPEAVMNSFEVAEKTAFGRNKTFSAIFLLPSEGRREIRENAIRFESEFGKRYGWRVFPSDWFSIQREGGTYHFTGRGFGHGVGLCESGALRLAQLGWDWEKILGFYFPSR